MLRHPFALLALATTLAVIPKSAAARFGDLRLGVEGGLATLAPPGQERRWGSLGASHLALGLSDRLGIQLLVDRKQFGGELTFTVDTYAAGFTYNLDVLWITPFLEASLAQVTLEGERIRGSELVPSFGAGFDVRVLGPLQFGGVVRYYALFDTELLERPGYATVQLRIALLLPLGADRRIGPSTR